MQKTTFILSSLLTLSLVSNGLLWYNLSLSNKSLGKAEASLRETLAEAQGTIASTTMRVAMLESLLLETQDMLQRAIDENEDLADDLKDEKDRNNEFEDQIDKIGSTVGTLDKLAKIDPELLQKYSKVFFLNEHYMPTRLSEIPNTYVYRNDGDPEFIHAQVAPHLKEMLEDALKDGVKIWVVSAFRSFDEQKSLKGAYTVAYGSGANAFSADQGYSEHQLGTTLDFTTENLGGGLTGFEATPAYEWLVKNAYKYGFVLSYPKDNAYYVFEPWHWRYVGEKLADDLHDDGKFFYDLDQREIDTYLISLFD